MRYSLRQSQFNFHCHYHSIIIQSIPLNPPDQPISCILKHGSFERHSLIKVVFYNRLSSFVSELFKKDISNVVSSVGSILQ